MDTEKDFSFAETQQQFFEEIRQATRPILWGPNATKYGLSLAQVYAIHEVAADRYAENDFYFNAGFSAGRRYERDHAERPKRQLSAWRRRKTWIRSK